MRTRTAFFLFGAVFFVSTAPRVSGAGRPASAQASSSSTKNSSSTTKKKKAAASAKSKSKKSSRVKAQAAPTPDRIKEIQTALQKDGSYDGEPTGKWDAATMDAMRKYQDKNGMNPTGKIDAVTLNKLGLGSETAGKGAPVPAASATQTPASTPKANASSAPAASALPDPK